MANSDEIVFGDVSVREPARLRRPDRDARRACVALGFPRADDLPIFLDRKPADAIERHALRDTSVELGGILLGKECVDDETGEPFVWVTEALEAKHYENTQASFTYTHDSWEDITRARERAHADLDIVGWYHTHPDFGIFLSSHDLFIHHHFFSQPLQVAYVVDPIRGLRGFFQWREGAVAALRGFFLSGDRTDRLALSRLANDLESLPNPESSGTLSPRLEAELITMLSRPQPASVVDRGSTAVVFGMLGVLLGALAVVVLFWLNALSQDIRAQSDALARLENAPKQGAAAGTPERVTIKERVLDSLLADVKVGTPPKSIRGRLTEALEQSESLRKQLELVGTEKEALARHAGLLGAEVADLRKKGENADRELQMRLEESESRVSELRNELQVQNKRVLEAEDGTVARNHNLLIWAAAGGWLAFVLASLGLLAVWLRRPNEGDDTHALLPRDPSLRIGSGAQSPPHVIE